MFRTFFQLPFSQLPHPSTPGFGWQLVAIMSLAVRRNMTLAAFEGVDSSKSGPFERLSLELLFQIVETDLKCADVLSLAFANRDLFTKLIGLLFEQGMKKNKHPLQWACTTHGDGPAALEA